MGELERKLHRVPTDEEISEKLGRCRPTSWTRAFTRLCRSSIAALDELWTILLPPAVDPVALIDTIEDAQGPEPQAESAPDGAEERSSARRSPACRSGRSHRSRSTTTRS